MGENGAFWFRHDARGAQAREALRGRTTRSAARRARAPGRHRRAHPRTRCRAAAIASDQAVPRSRPRDRFPRGRAAAAARGGASASSRSWRPRALTAKVSSIHVNGWFGGYDKLSTTRLMMREDFAHRPRRRAARRSCSRATRPTTSRCSSSSPTRSAWPTCADGRPHAGDSRSGSRHRRGRRGIRRAGRRTDSYEVGGGFPSEIPTSLRSKETFSGRSACNELSIGAKSGFRRPGSEAMNGAGSCGIPDSPCRGSCETRSRRRSTRTRHRRRARRSRSSATRRRSSGVPRNGARVVARAWVDPDVPQAPARQRPRMRSRSWASRCRSTTATSWCSRTRPKVQNVICCTLCSCTAFTIIGLPPDWYKDLEYRSRVVRESRTVLKEMGLDLPPEVEIRVWDTTADTRYMVLPEQPPHTHRLAGGAAGRRSSRATR